MFTGGVGALIGLPNFPVLVRGLDEWRYETVPEWEPLTEPRLLAAVGKLLSAPVRQLRPPPWLPETPDDFTGQASGIGVPVMPFLQWLRCTAQPAGAAGLRVHVGLVNDKPRRLEEAKFFHQDCPRRKSRPLDVAARFVLACVNRHLDDFPYREFVHRGGACPEASLPALLIDDYGGNRGANVMIRARAADQDHESRAAGRAALLLRSSVRGATAALPRGIQALQQQGAARQVTGHQVDGVPPAPCRQRIRLALGLIRWQVSLSASGRPPWEANRIATL
jgi:hypothetical protein